jgi:NAD(P)-dependent dehydrogenase (short-subunit alcohol dehydrogenase family)/aminoglycoside phosphotransferase (APT) family kinase protein
VALGDELDGRVAIVTGGSRGIGLAIAHALAASGASVMLTSRRPEALEAAARTFDGRVAWFAANAGDAEGARAAVEATMSRFGSVDILVNNAGANPYVGPLVDLDESRALKTVQVNQFGPVAWAAAVWKAWMSSHGGAILNIASLGAQGVAPGLGYYDGTKAALIAMTRQLAYELAPNVRVNAIAPGLVKTDMARAVWETHEEELSKRTLLGRLGDPQDIAELARFLLSDRASWITGVSVVADGGMICMPLGAEHLANVAQLLSAPTGAKGARMTEIRIDRGKAAERQLAIEDLTDRVTRIAQAADPSCGVSQVLPMPGGVSSLTFSATLSYAGSPPMDVIIKVAPRGLPPVANRDVLRQARVLRVLRDAAGVRVPVVLMEDAGDPPETPPWFAMNRVSGDSFEPIQDETGEPLPPAEVAARCASGLAMLAALQQVDPGRVGLRDEIPVSLVNEVQRWARIYATVPEELRLGADWVQAKLLERLPHELPPVIVHGDYRLGNMLAAEGRINAIIDWEIWALGDPRLDLAWYLLNCDARAQHTSVQQAAGFPSAEALVADYGSQSGILHLDELGWFDVLSRFKAGAIVAQIIKHNRRSGTPNPRVQRWDPEVPVRFLADAIAATDGLSRGLV